MKRIGSALVTLGAAVVIIALGWWWLTYREAIQFSYIAVREAGYCIVGETEICASARALCRDAHPSAIATYSWFSLWFGFALLCVGLVLDGWRRPEGDDDGSIVPADFWF